MTLRFGSWRCRHLDWHPQRWVTVIDFDGVSLVGRCGRCGCRVLCDSQGNWFRALAP